MIIFTAWGSRILLVQSSQKQKQKLVVATMCFGCNKALERPQGSCLTYYKTNTIGCTSLLQDKHKTTNNSFLFSSIFSSTSCITQTPNSRLFSSMKLLWKERNNPKIWVPSPFFFFLLLLVEEEFLLNKSCPRNFLVLQGYPNRFESRRYLELNNGR